MSFGYLRDKIRAAPISERPFRHIDIPELFQPRHLAEILRSPEVNTKPAASDEALFPILFEAGYRIVNFPGCVIDKDEYIVWRRDRGALDGRNNPSCEGFGVTLRLAEIETPIIADLLEYLESGAFLDTLAEKFGVDRRATSLDAGVQKYLDGYEISPHPDIRRKALTYMVNINPAPRSERLDHHTHYMRLKPEHRHVRRFWEANPQLDRCWVPWDWCETEKVQSANNSLVAFAPYDGSLHAVRAAYDHLEHQRTQLYGNLWFKDAATEGTPEWWELGGEAPPRDQRCAWRPSAPPARDQASFVVANRLGMTTRRK